MLPVACEVDVLLLGGLAHLSLRDFGDVGVGLRVEQVDQLVPLKL
jgi:hypothetical protein